MRSPFISVELSWEPRISYLLAGLDLDSCDDEVREKMKTYNPNCSPDRSEIVKLFVLPALEYLSYRHRFAILELLETSLVDKGIDFSVQFETDYDECSSTVWDETEIEDPRGFFEEIFKLAGEQWKDDLQKASLEDQSTW
ncbi:hypothetical protein [Pseudomonas fluorescens]|uniref:Uncharacterized protein n=1 Tax=Pseudomonas fluorescens TaxID=294 RepID=A0A5E7HIY4_PSEFL|nr:hypothetical protein [Pseudomonas fluorescens]VVO64209.1 hypothetical protein PS854_00947 [Pseudomonas fluorescens]